MKISIKKRSKKNQKKSRLVNRNLQMAKKVQKEKFQNKKQIGGFDDPLTLPVIFEINNSKNEQYRFSSILGNPINPSADYLTNLDAINKENAQPRINSQSGWVSATNDGWITIDLQNEKSVAGIAIQGKYCGSLDSIVPDWEGLNKVIIKTSADYIQFIDQGTFETNIPKNDTIQYIFFEKPIQARFVIISAVNFVKSVSMRVDALLEKQFNSIGIPNTLSNLEDIDLSDVIDTDAASLVAPNDIDGIYNLNFGLNDSSTYTYTSKTEISPYNDEVQPQINSPYGCVLDINDTLNVLVINLNAIKNVIGVAIQGYNCQNMNNCENWEGTYEFEIMLRANDQNWNNPGTFNMDDIQNWLIMGRTQLNENSLKNDRIKKIFFANPIQCQYIGIHLLNSIGKKALRADALILDERIGIARPELGPAIYRNCRSSGCERWLPYVVYTRCTSSCDEEWNESWKNRPIVDAIEPPFVFDLSPYATFAEIDNHDKMLKEYKILRSYSDFSDQGRKEIETSKAKIAYLKANSGRAPDEFTKAKKWGQEYQQKALADVLNYSKHYYMVALHMYNIGEYAEAALHYRNAIQLGHIPSRAKLAWLLLFGRKGIPQSVKQAYELVKDFNDNNNDCKSIKYFIRILNKIIDADDINIDNETLIKLVKEISDKTSNVYANYCLGMIANGMGSDDKIKYFHRSSQQSLDAGIYFFGLINENQDFKIQAYNKSAEQGFPLAFWQLGYFYMERNDNESAIKFFLKFLETNVDYLIGFNFTNAKSASINLLIQLGYKPNQ